MSFLSNMKIRHKLYVAFGFIVVLSILISAIAVNSLQNSVSVADGVHEYIDIRYKRISTSSNLSTASNNLLSLYLSPGNQTPQNKQAFEENLAKALTAVNALDSKLYPVEVPKLQQDTKHFAELYQSTILPLIEAGKPFDALAFYLDQMQPIATSLANLHVAVTESLVGHINVRVAGLRDHTALIIVICSAIAVILLGVLTSWFISTYISNRLKEQQDIANAIAKNDLSIDIPQKGTDEFGELSSTLRQMRNDLSQSISMVLDVANSLREVTHDVNSSSKEIVDSARHAENQTVTVAATSEEMVSTTADIARNCENAASLSEQSKNITLDGVGVVRDTVSHIQEQSNRTNQDAEKIQTLAEQTEKIGSIVSTIDDIAAQTNLLALNAAIEAARAGEAGRGFAVVADEVRALASRTTKSTQEISQMVSQIQTDANIATQSMGASVENMNNVAVMAGDLENVLHNVLEHVNNVNGQITQIATAAEEQTTATSEISTNMQGITSRVQVVVNKSESAIALADNAVNTINELVRNLSRFKLRNGNLDS